MAWSLWAAQVRMGHNDLGTQHLAMGNLNEALKCFIRTRDYGTTDKHTVTPATPPPPPLQRLRG